MRREERRRKGGEEDEKEKARRNADVNADEFEKSTFNFYPVDWW